VPDDAGILPEGHQTNPPNGWTDARFNSWSNSSLSDYKPEDSLKSQLLILMGENFLSRTISFILMPLIGSIFLVGMEGMAELIFIRTMYSNKR